MIKLLSKNNLLLTVLCAAVFIFLIVPQANAAFSLVRSGSTGNVATLVASTTLPSVTAGDLLVMVNVDLAGCRTIVASDTVNGTWGTTNRSPGACSGNNAIQLTFFPNSAGSAVTTTFTATYNSALPANSFPRLTVLEYSGAATSSPLDVSIPTETFSTSSVSSYTTPSITTAHAEDLIIAYGGSSANQTTSSLDSPFTIRVLGVGRLFTGDDYTTSTGTFAPTFTVATSSNPLFAGIAAFRASPSPPGAPGTPTYSGQASSTPGSVTASWSASSGSPDYYKIENSTDGNTFSQVATTSATSYTTTTLSSNTTYWYRVRGTDNSIDGTYSASSSVFTYPGTPGTPSYTNVSTSTLTVSWTNPTGGASSTKIERAPDSGGSPGTFAQIATTTATTYNDSGLSTSTVYWYRVRSTNATGDGLYSANASTTTSGGAGDTSPPTPNPMAFSSSGPTASSTTSVSMAATSSAADATPPINYLFINVPCAANGGTGGTSSSWQSGTTYTNSGLQVNQCYAYEIQARDSVGSPNTGTASASSSVYTLANAPGAPTLSSATTSTLNFANDANGNPASTPTTVFAAYVSSTSPNDSNWQGKYIDAFGAASVSEVWMSDATLDALVIKQLATSTTYTIEVKAKNNDGIQTAFGPAANGATSPFLGNCGGGTGNISTSTTAHWAWNDSIGWIDFCSNGTVNVSSTGISGYASSSAGEVSLDCATSPSGDICGSSNYQVLNDGSGNLTGWAWNDLYGWISFCGGSGSANCPGSTSYQVTIDSSGNFSGFAWNDVAGWISFNCNQTIGNTCGNSDYKLMTTWTGATVATSTGVLDSATYDTGITSGAQLNSLLWHGYAPAGTSVYFQIAVSNNSNGPWNFMGTDGTANTYYSGNADTPIPLDYSLFSGYRYFRYRVTLIGNSNGWSPRVDDVVVKWSP